MSSRVRATTDVAKRRREEPTLNPPNVPLELATIETTIEEFTKLPSYSFETFKKKWRENVIANVETPKSNIAQSIERMHQLYCVARANVASSERSLLHRVAALFALYVLFETQFCQPRVSIPLSFADSVALQQLREQLQQSTQQQPTQHIAEALRVDEYLRASFAYCLVADGSSDLATDDASATGAVSGTAGDDTAAVTAANAVATTTKFKRNALVAGSKAAFIALARIVPTQHTFTDVVDVDALEYAANAYELLSRDLVASIADRERRATLQQQYGIGLPAATNGVLSALSTNAISTAAAAASTSNTATAMVQQLKNEMNLFESRRVSVIRAGMDDYQRKISSKMTSKSDSSKSKRNRKRKTTSSKTKSTRATKSTAKRKSRKRKPSNDGDDDNDSDADEDDDDDDEIETNDDDDGDDDDDNDETNLNDNDHNNSVFFDEDDDIDDK